MSHKKAREHDSAKSEQHPRKHHYIPVFYLRQWAGHDGRLLEYQRPYRTVVSKWKHPDATGYEVDLYKINGFPSTTAQQIETGFMRMTDSLAADALSKIKSDLPLNLMERSAWSRFIMSLMIRNPEGVANIKGRMRQDWLDTGHELWAKIKADPKSTDPKSYAEMLEWEAKGGVEAYSLRALAEIIDSKNIGNHMIGMRWYTIRLSKGANSLLTSDRPLSISNGIGRPQSFILLPIDDKTAFCAVNNETTYRRITAISNYSLSSILNTYAVGHARRFVYGSDESQDRFVRNRMSKLVERSFYTQFVTEAPF